ncbi:claudin-1 isoform X1 [Centroberyx affinis]|uniref:claudin-1 isoform X1 n=1 Tax=Centroberyx affinis TaxID=166261 RepID=UPI003A5BA056
MANGGIQLLGFVLAFLGFIGLIASTIMPEWKASSYAGDNIITAQALYEGLWKTCVSQSTGQVQCKVYDSLLQLPGIVQGTRGLMVASILLCAISILVAVVGMRCTTCLADDTEQKDKVALAGGVVFIVSGQGSLNFSPATQTHTHILTVYYLPCLCALVGTSWYGNRIAQEFYDPFTPTNARYEFGKALFVGWGAACLTIIGGAFLCCNCSSKESGKAPRYPPSRSAGQPGRDYV